MEHGPPQPSRGATPGSVLRWLLLAAVVAGIFGMHVLTAEDGGDHHGALPMVSANHTATGLTGHGAGATVQDGMTPTAEHTSMVSDAVSGAPAGVEPASPATDHNGMAGCILYLVAGITVLILALLGYRRSTEGTGVGRFARAALTDLRRRGPPGRYRPRVALCVIRI